MLVDLTSKWSNLFVGLSIWPLRRARAESRSYVVQRTERKCKIYKNSKLVVTKGNTLQYYEKIF